MRAFRKFNHNASSTTLASVWGRPKTNGQSQAIFPKTSAKCITIRNKCIATSDKKLLATSASLLVTTTGKIRNSLKSGRSHTLDPVQEWGIDCGINLPRVIVAEVSHGAMLLLWGRPNHSIILCAGCAASTQAGQTA